MDGIVHDMTDSHHLDERNGTGASGVSGCPYVATNWCCPHSHSQSLLACPASAVSPLAHPTYPSLVGGLPFFVGGFSSSNLLIPMWVVTIPSLVAPLPPALVVVVILWAPTGRRLTWTLPAVMLTLSGCPPWPSSFLCPTRQLFAWLFLCSSAPAPPSVSFRPLPGISSSFPLCLDCVGPAAVMEALSFKKNGFA